jgi:hypothetical protein
MKNKTTLIMLGVLVFISAIAATQAKKITIHLGQAGNGNATYNVTGNYLPDNLTDCPADQYVYGATSSSFKCREDQTGGGGWSQCSDAAACNWITNAQETDQKWTANYTIYNGTWSSTVNQTYDTGSKYATNGTYYLASNPSGYITAATETDRKWTANYTVCPSSQKLYFDGNKNLACADDLTGSGSETNSAKNSSFYSQYTDFEVANVNLNRPWLGAAVASGTQAVNATDLEMANHPGVLTFTSSTTTNSGWQYTTSITSFLIAGGESSTFIFNSLNVTGTYGSQIRMGFQDSILVTDPVDGVYLKASGNNLTGICRSNSGQTLTGTGYTITQAVWYRGTIGINAAANNVTFRLYNQAGTLLWENYCVTNIPSGAGRYTGHGVVATLVGITARQVMSIDYMSVWITRTLVR